MEGNLILLVILMILAWITAGTMISAEPRDLPPLDQCSEGENQVDYCA
jgi:hypothetical protein